MPIRMEAARRAILLQVFKAYAGQETEIGRHQRQDARRQERQQPRPQRPNQRDIRNHGFFRLW